MIAVDARAGDGDCAARGAEALLGLFSLLSFAREKRLLRGTSDLKLWKFKSRKRWEDVTKITKITIEKEDS